MNQVVRSLERKHVELRINVIKLEIDYWLTTLHDAMVENNDKHIKEAKQKLENYRQELLRLNKLVR